MSWSFNPFTGNLDLVGSGGGSTVFEGEVATFADLPVTIGDPAVGAAYLVRDSTGVWLVNRRQAGIYIRRNNTGVAATDWEYGGDYPVNSVNNQTGNVVLAASDVGAAAALTIASSITISTDTTLIGGRNVQQQVTSYSSSVLYVTLPDTGNQVGDTFILLGRAYVENFIIRGRNHDGSGTGPEFGNIATISGPYDRYTFRATNTSFGGWILIPSDTHTHAASDVNSGTFDNARINFAAPAAIGSTTPATGTFTTLNSTIASGAGITITDTNTSVDYNNLFECVRDSNVLFNVRDDGAVTALLAMQVGTNVGFVTQGGGNGGVRIRADYSLHWVSTGFTNTGTPDTFLRRDAQANTLAMYNSTNAQEFRLYNTRTSSTNFERLSIGWASNIVSIKPEAGGGGGTVRELHISGLPTSNPGPGILWNDSGTVKVGT